MMKYSLESRLCLLITGLLFALLLAVGHLQMTAQQTCLLEEQTDHYASISALFAVTNRQINDTRVDPIYSSLSGRLMSVERGIAYVLIVDRQNRVVYADFRNYSKSKSNLLIGQNSKAMGRMARQQGIDISPYARDITFPLKTHDNQRRSVVIGLAPVPAGNAATELEATLLTTFAIALIVGIVFSMFLAKAILRPISELMGASRAVADGDMNVRVTVRTKDEIGQLCQRFNDMVESVRDNQERLIQRANTDSLTDLYNHRYFQERLSSELSRAARYNHPLSMIMLDVDNFKNLNDTYGHPFGDLVLQQIAKTLEKESRDIDIVARYGGEEFALILPETKVNDAEILAERLRLAVLGCSFEAERDPVQVTISLGISQYPVHSTEREGLIMAADLAMYQSKSLGRNRITSYSNDLQSDDSSDPYKLYMFLHARDFGTIEAMAAAVDAKGHRPPGFSLEVMKHSVALADEFALSEEEKGNIRIAALLHDIGKLGVPEVILMKHGALTEEESMLVRNHPSMGHAIVQKSPHLQAMLPGILYHHERWDGKGYPKGLNGDSIPVIARIIAVVDAFHAMTTDRPYKKGLSYNAAIAEMRKCSGTQFDPEVVEAFIRVLSSESQAKAA